MTDPVNFVNTAFGVVILGVASSIHVAKLRAKLIGSKRSKLYRESKIRLQKVEEAANTLAEICYEVGQPMPKLP